MPDGEDDDSFTLLGIPLPVGDADKVTSPFFPSKIGGKPAWLDLKSIPSIEDVKCENCGAQMQFLLQLYSPIPEKDDCFHRTIFVFACLRESCSGSSPIRTKTFRCQLPVKNAFYPSDGLPTVAKAKEILRNPDIASHTCSICGMYAGKRCSVCKTMPYCSREHQVEHWKAGHKNGCSRIEDYKSSTVLAELKIDIVEEEYESSEDGSEAEETNEALLRQFNSGDDEMDGETEEIFKSSKDLDIDKEFLRYQERMKSEPSQVVRYFRNNPDDLVWVSSKNLPEENDIPKCKYCGGLMTPEFQIMPQILYYLDTKDGVIPVEFGTMVAYTCEASCSLDVDSTVYKEEFVWVQSI